MTKLRIMCSKQQQRGSNQQYVKDAPERGLIITRQWLDEILSGMKTLEIRSRNHSFAGQRVYLVEKKSGRVRGAAILGSCRPLTKKEERINQAALKFTHYVAPIAWLLHEVSRFETPWVMSGAARTNSQPWVLRYRWEKDPSDQPEDFSQLHTAIPAVVHVEVASERDVASTEDAQGAQPKRKRVKPKIVTSSFTTATRLVGSS